MALKHDLIMLNENKDLAAVAGVIPEVRRPRELSASPGR